MISKRIVFSLVVGSILLLALSGNIPLMGSETGDEIPRAGSNAEGISSVDSLLQGEIQVSLPTTPECDRYLPAVAFNYVHNEYLVVWHNTWQDGHRDIYARRVSQHGDLLSWFSVSSGSNDRAQPAVAYNAANDEYLIVWMYNASGDGTTYDIWGKTIAWNGAYQNTEFEIITWTDRTFWTPRVAWNSYRNEYMVVWSAFDTNSMTPTDVANAVLEANGHKRYGTILSSADDPHQADITYNVAADEYLVVWRTMASSANGDIKGARVSGSAGTVVNPPGVFTINAAAEDQRYPAVTTNQQDRYMVAWEHQYPYSPYDWDIRGQSLDVNASMVGSPFYIASTNDDEVSPMVVARPGAGLEYITVWQKNASGGEEIWATHRKDGVLEFFPVSAIGFWDNETPAVAWGRISYLFAFAGDSQGDPTVYRHIYGHTWFPYVVFVPFLQRPAP